MNARPIVPLAVIALAWAILPTDARAVLAIYNIQSLQSALTVTGDLTGSTAGPQAAGSTVTNYSGTIVADLNPGNILFPGGSNVDAAVKGNYQPDNDGFDDTDPADYGRRTPDGGGPFGSTTFEAIRDLAFDVRDATSGAGAAVAGNGTFASTAFNLRVISGESDTIFGLGGSPDLDLVGEQTANTSGNGLSSVVLSGSTETLTLRFATDAIPYGVSSGGDSSMSFTGTIVATREIPEPAGAIVLGAFTALALLRRRALGR